MLFKLRFNIAKGMGVLALVLILGAAAHANQRTNGYDAYQSYSRDIISSAIGDGLENGAAAHAANIEAVNALYKARDNEPFWLTRYSKADLEKVLTLFEESWTHGLNPENYHASSLAPLIERMHTQKNSKKARLEVLLSEAALRYAQDMAGMRVLQHGLFDKEAYWRTPLQPEDVFAAIEKSEDPAKILADYAPKGAFYEAMRKELVALSLKFAEEEEGQKEPIKFDRPYFMPGEAHGDIPKLRKRLQVSYEPQTGSGYSSPRIYDDKLAAAVIKFQKENRLTPDGILGPQTVAALNFSTRDRINQLITNMERVRWMTPSLPSKYIFVNAASQKLWGIDEGAVKLQMDVIVGHPLHRTKIFKAQVEGVRFNPEWNVPLSIKMRYFLPQLREDSYALTDKGIEFVRGYGANAVTLDPGTIDWKNVGWREMSKIRMVQTPGDHNALGRVRILMPNGYDIYLHDTNDKELFRKDMRALSSGCIRMAQPLDTASFVLAGEPEGTPEAMQEILSGLDTQEVYINKTIPVYVAYQSVWLDEDGKLVYGTDIYKRDRDLARKLAELDALYDPARHVPDSANMPTDLASVRVMP